MDGDVVVLAEDYKLAGTVCGHHQQQGGGDDGGGGGGVHVAILNSKAAAAIVLAGASPLVLPRLLPTEDELAGDDDRPRARTAQRRLQLVLRDCDSD